MKHKIFLKNVAVISIGGLIAKIIGALYRIPLTNILGGYGMGLYQMAYPLFCVLLSFTSTGIPSALARVIARDEARGGEGESTLIVSLKFFALLGACGTLIMILLSTLMSKFQGDDNLIGCYYALAPSVFLVALISVFRGYFQGKNNMNPTAISEVVEQVIKSAFGIIFAQHYAKNVPLAVQYSLFSVTISEAIALFYLIYIYRKQTVKKLIPRKKIMEREIFISVFPVMLSVSLLPFSHVVDSIFLVRLLGADQRAVSLYGLFAGSAVSIISLPATACAGLATAVVPSVSTCYARGQQEEGLSRALLALLLTIALALPCAIILFFGADKIVPLLYASLSKEDGQVLSSLLRLLSVSSILLAGIDTLSACLTGMGRAKLSARSMALAVLIKFVLEAVLVPNPAFSVLGAGIAANACYLLAFFLDLFYTVRKKREANHDYDYRTGNGGRRSDARGVRSASRCGYGSRKEFLPRCRGIDEENRL